MTPIYASDRSDISGWYAYDFPPEGRRVFWDGGVGKRDQLATGFWCPYTGNIVDAPDRLVSSMPDIALECILHGNDVLVTGFPRIEYLTGFNGSNLGSAVMSETPGANDVRYLYDDPQDRANFIDEITIGPEMLEGTPCRVIQVEQLPDDKHAALDYFRERFPLGIARHPMSIWTPLRTVFAVANIKPGEPYLGRVREINLRDSMEVIESVSVWVTIEKELKVQPLYPGDDDPDCPFWKLKSPITLYCMEDLVIGYE
jgi:hypothetical protein